MDFDGKKDDNAGEELEVSLMPQCFIATAVYGNENAPELHILRDFRDNVLNKNYLGKRFVEFYYSGTGEKVAEVIKEIPFTIPLIRKGLDYFIHHYESQINNNISIFRRFRR